MKPKPLHPWNLSYREAVEVQHGLASLVSCTSHIPNTVHYIAGVDISAPYSRGLTKGAVVVVEFPGLEVAEVEVAEVVTDFPYIPGLLSFREIPVLVETLARLSLAPDLLVVDGQGRAHPRRIGIASHVGLLYDMPTIGCAKSILVGTHEELGQEAGVHAALVDRDEVVGAAVRTRDSTKPVYVSIGHKVDLQSAVEWVLACTKGYRLPEPTRLAHQAAAGRIAVGLRRGAASQAG